MVDVESNRIRRFGDWRMALKSIVAFWSIYAVTVVTRAVLGEDPLTILINKIPLIVAGLILTGLIYASINLFAVRGSWRRQAIVAMIASVLAAIALSAIAIQADRYQDVPNDEIHYVSTEGYQVTDYGNHMRIERPGEAPFTLTWPRLHELDPWYQFRVTADVVVAWLFFFGAWSAFYLALVSQGRAHRLRHRAISAEANARSAQLRALRYQVNPHFLFNTLNSLSSLVITDRKDRAEEMLLAMSNFFRSTLALDQATEIPLSEEIDLQRLYLDIEKVRFPKRLHATIEVPANLSEARVPALILQPLVENAIKYGVARSKGATDLVISAEETSEGQLLLRVINSGTAGKAAKATDSGTGLGLRNVEQRLEARYGERASCRFGPRDEGGYEARLLLPLDLGDE